MCSNDGDVSKNPPLQPHAVTIGREYSTPCPTAPTQMIGQLSMIQHHYESGETRGHHPQHRRQHQHQQRHVKQKMMLGQYRFDSGHPNRGDSSSSRKHADGPRLDREDADTDSTDGVHDAERDAERLEAGESRQVSSTGEEPHLEKELLADPYALLEETEEKIAKSLDFLERTLTGIRKKNAYDRAVFLRPTYVRSRAFRLMFLRADRFNVSQTAKRIIHHFEVKQELFGINKLVRDITWSDLSVDDQDSCVTGTVQMFPNVKDSHGRLLLQQVCPARQYGRVENRIRALWWMTMASLRQDEEGQMKGVVSVIHARKITPENLDDVARRTWSGKIERALPMRTIIVHLCFNDRSLAKPLETKLSEELPLHIRKRVQCHSGSHTKCQNALATYGISDEVTLIDEASLIRMGPFTHQLGHLLSFEGRAMDAHMEAPAQTARSEASTGPETASTAAKAPTATAAVASALAHLNCRDDGIPSQPSGRIEHPLANDVLLGRGYPFQQFPGNMKMLDLVKLHKPRHDAASMNRKNKTAIATMVVDGIKQNGGRFLKRSDSGSAWVEVDDAVAREKAAMGFRNLSRKSNSAR